MMTLHDEATENYQREILGQCLDGGILTGEVMIISASRNVGKSVWQLQVAHAELIVEQNEIALVEEPPKNKPYYRRNERW